MTNITLNRADLTRLFPDDPKAQKAFEQLFAQTVSNTQAVTTGIAATQDIVDATVITLSPNDALNNERVLAVDPQALTITDTGATVILALANLITKTGPYRLNFQIDGDTSLSIPQTGRIPSSDDGPYASDSAAATAGVRVGEIYKAPSGALAWRQV